ncbi:MAG: hypothetical protein U1U88_000987 [Lawsonella clevelandensis]
MATRTMPSSKDRIATIMAAPLMTCSARLPVYLLLVGMLVDPGQRVGPFSVQGIALFGLYVLGGASAMFAAWAFKRTSLKSTLLPFYMEMPPYRIPTGKTVLSDMWKSTSMFLRKVGRIILVATIVIWALMNIPPNSRLLMNSIWTKRRRYNTPSTTPQPLPSVKQWNPSSARSASTGASPSA